MNLDMGVRAAAVAGFSAAVYSILKVKTPMKTRVLPRHNKLEGKSPHTISIVSYNVLCDTFSTPDRLPNVPKPCLQYPYRWQLLQRELAEFGSDVVCLQEASIDKWQELKQFMAHLGYDGVVQLKPHEVKLAVFWRCSRLALVWWEERSRAVLTELALTIDSSAAPETVYVVNVHLEGSPYRSRDRLSQLRHALQRLAHHIEATGRQVQTAKLLLVGDFNSEARDAPSVFLKQGHLPAGFKERWPLPQEPVTTEEMRHPFELYDVYEAAQAVPPYTRKVGSSGGARLDFVWASQTLQLDAVLRPLPLEHRELVQRAGMPNFALPSDHLPVGAVLRLPSNQQGDGEGDDSRTAEQRRNREPI